MNVVLFVQCTLLLDNIMILLARRFRHNRLADVAYLLPHVETIAVAGDFVGTGSFLWVAVVGRLLMHVGRPAPTGLPLLL